MRLDYKTAAPEGFKHILGLLKYVAGSGLDEKLVHLLYLRVSQINGCPYCVDMHWKDAKAAGEDLRKLNAVTVWRDTPFFSDPERAALAWAEAVTRVTDAQVPAEVFAALRLHFTEKAVTDMTYAVALMNALNRLAIAFEQQPEA